MRRIVLAFGAIFSVASVLGQTPKKPIQISGIYPHLSFFNNEGECGTGAVVPWANRLWAITYGPHMPYGSSDKLYEITPDLQMIRRPESIGGTPANRMIHKESNQLFIGPYAIDTNRRVRVIPVKTAPGRFTGIARSVSDPANKVVIATMEEGFYEVDVHDLSVNTFFKDGNQQQREGLQKTYESSLLPGVHGKGFYSSQGVYVFSNNGEDGVRAKTDPKIQAGCLAEWDAKNNWKVLRRNQFTEVTGPGGIYGNANPSTDQIWATGWDYKSVILGLREKGNWTFYRLPKASCTYDGAHGWNTEWPRIRNIGTEQKPDYLMTMHGMFWRFPKQFSVNNAGGIRPRSSYLKVIGDFTRWNNQLVFGCDDAAKSEFLNKRKAKGGIEAPGQSQSNLWFTSFGLPDSLGNTNAIGSVWQKEKIEANQASDAFLFAGWKNRTAWLKNEGDSAVTFSFQIDAVGNNQWTNNQKVTVAPHSTATVDFPETTKAEWIKLSINKTALVSASFVYGNSVISNHFSAKMFTGLSGISDAQSIGGLLYTLGNNRKNLGVVACDIDKSTVLPTNYYELNEQLELVAKKDTTTANFITAKMAIPKNVVSADSASFIIVDDFKRKWRLPFGNKEYNQPTAAGQLRICREVATERDLFSLAGTFYELPAENADGFAKIRPIASHNYRIHDYASFRGMIVMSGISLNAPQNNPHIIKSADNKCAVWVGAIDDLWKLGTPTGYGGPWLNTKVAANVPSDAYLFGYYPNKKLTLSHASNKAVKFIIEIDPTGDNNWFQYKSIVVEPGKPATFNFPKNAEGRWIRFNATDNTTASAQLTYF